MMNGMHMTIPWALLLAGTGLGAAPPDGQVRRIEVVRAVLKSVESRERAALDDLSGRLIQHNPRIADGRAGVEAWLNAAPAGSTVRIVRIFADGDYVVAHNEYNLSGRSRKVAFDVFRFEGSQIVEHWDNVQEECPSPNASGRTQLDGPTQVIDLDRTEANREVMRGYFRDVVFGGKRDKATLYKSVEGFHQHNCQGEDVPTKPLIAFKYDTLHKVLAQGNFVLMMSEGVLDGDPTTFYDLYRLEDGKQVEHWDVLEPAVPRAEWKNANGKF
jgi:predicted SnoaL-like aldol condensation-catalyzing enzyme